MSKVAGIREAVISIGHRCALYLVVKVQAAVSVVSPPLSVETTFHE
jgi:hypothetical protein